MVDAKFDGLVKSRNGSWFVIPAQSGKKIMVDSKITNRRMKKAYETLGFETTDAEQCIHGIRFVRMAMTP